MTVNIWYPDANLVPPGLGYLIPRSCPPERNPHAARIRGYLARYEEAFADELCAWCVEHGEVRTLFALEHAGVLDTYLDQFFARHRHPGVQWIQDAGKGRYGIAASVLLEEADSAGELSAKQVRSELAMRS